MVIWDSASLVSCLRAEGVAWGSQGRVAESGEGIRESGRRTLLGVGAGKWLSEMTPRCARSQRKRLIRLAGVCWGCGGPLTILDWDRRHSEVYVGMVSLCVNCVEDALEKAGEVCNYTGMEDVEPRSAEGVDPHEYMADVQRRVSVCPKCGGGFDDTDVCVCDQENSSCYSVTRLMQ